MIDPLEYSIVNGVIGSMRKELPDLFDSAIEPEVSCYFIKRRTFSTVAKLKIAFPDKERSLFVKIPNSKNKKALEKIKKEYDVINFFYGKYKEQQKSGIIKPVFFCQNPPALVTEETPGVTLKKIIESRARFFPSGETLNILKSICKSCGESLRFFQSIWPIPENLGNNKTYKHNETINFINYQLEQCVAGKLFHPKFAGILKKYMINETVHLSNSTTRIAGMHSDFCLSNLMFDGTNVELLDFGAFQFGPTCRDVANFLYSLDILTCNPIFRPITIESLKPAFLEGYKWNDHEENLPLLRLFRIRETLGGIIFKYKTMQKSLINQIKLNLLKKRSKAILLSLIHKYSQNL